jgi:hypothetical protein
MDGKQNTKNSAYKLTLLHFIQILSVDYFHCWGHAVSLQPGRSRVRFPVLVVAQSSSEIPEGLMNNPVLCPSSAWISEQTAIFFPIQH